jgi:uncharacterized OsmC-like protein
MTIKKAVVKQLQGITLAAKAETNNWVMMDGRDAWGGEAAGPTPKELLLKALGGRPAMDVIPILRERIPRRKSAWGSCTLELCSSLVRPIQGGI